MYNPQANSRPTPPFDSPVSMNTILPYEAHNTRPRISCLTIDGPYRRSRSAISAIRRSSQQPVSPGASAQQGDDYQPGPDSVAQPGVPKGEVLKFTFENSKIFPGTYRDYWVYVP